MVGQLVEMWGLDYGMVTVTGHARMVLIAAYDKDIRL